MPTEIEIRPATSIEHEQFVARIPEVKLLGRPTLCGATDGAVMVVLSTEQEVGGACYVPGASHGTRATIINLFSILPEHRARPDVEAGALSALEKELAAGGTQVALATPSTDGFSGTLQRRGYVYVGRGYLMKALST
jgi:hypothetical protein